MAFTRYTGNLTGSVGSLITALDAALVDGEGWTKAFSGTNKAAYQMPAGSTQHFLRVDDNGTGIGGAKEALIRAGEAMTGVDTFSANPFPTTALTGQGLVARKSATVDGTTLRPYVIYADQRGFLFFCKSETASYYYLWAFGEIYSLAPNDAYRTAIIGRATESQGSVSVDPLYNSVGTLQSTPLQGCFLCRNYLGAGGGIGFIHHVNNITNSGMWFGAAQVPNGPDGSIALQRILISEYTGGVAHLRGRIRGLWRWGGNTMPWNDGDTISGVGDLTGRTFELRVGMLAASPATALVETSDTLETN